MLTVPQEVKDLLHLDTCQKNIRIHFPNGERSDICNDLIVLDSVSFTESLCSQDSLKFGLCEASVFQCETVGVGEVSGAVIEVFCEIFCDSFVSGSVFKTDIQHYVYPISYGTFVVESSKRQADVNHRKIIAYGGTSIFSNDNDIYNFIVRQGLTSKTAYQPVVFNLAAMCTNAKAALDDAPLTIQTTDTYPYYFELVKDNMLENYWGVSVDCVRFQITSQSDWDYLFYTERTNPDKNESEIVELLDDGYMPSQLKKAIYDGKWKGIGLATGNTITAPGLPMSAFSQGAFIYPYQASYSYINVCIPYKIQYIEGSLLSMTRRVVAEYQFRDPADQKIYKVNTSNYPQYRLKYKRNNKNGGMYFIDASSLDVVGMLQNVTELTGKFCILDRSNKIKLLDIQRNFDLNPSTTLYPGSSVYPEGVTGGKLLPQDYQSCWYENRYSLPYGAIRVAYTDTNDEEAEEVVYIGSFSSGSLESTYKEYNLTDNEYIRSKTFTANDIQSICSDIANSLNGVEYIPVDLIGRGLPYVEPGDTFEVLTKSNDSITTIVLNRTLSGEQVLTDSYKSV